MSDDLFTGPGGNDLVNLNGSLRVLCVPELSPDHRVCAKHHQRGEFGDQPTVSALSTDRSLCPKSRFIMLRRRVRRLGHPRAIRQPVA